MKLRILIISIIFLVCYQNGFAKCLSEDIEKLREADGRIKAGSHVWVGAGNIPVYGTAGDIPSENTNTLKMG